jgi:hypothetical protein
MTSRGLGYLLFFVWTAFPMLNDAAVADDIIPTKTTHSCLTPPRPTQMGTSRSLI